MSELKAKHVVDVYDDYAEHPCEDYSQVYLKSEADKVIAELEMKLAAAKLVLRLNEPEALYSNLDTMSRLNHKIDVVERRELHQKYKRCLAMATFCHVSSVLCEGPDSLFYRRWFHKWHELAEKFKEE